MATTDANVIVRLIYDTACIYLCQHVSKGAMDVVIPEEEPLTGRDFLWKLQKRDVNRKRLS